MRRQFNSAWEYHFNKGYGMKIFKVRDKLTGKYSQGGYCPGFSNIGKTYNSVGSVRSHIRQFLSLVEQLSNYKQRTGKDLHDFDVAKLEYAQRYLDKVEIVEFNVAEAGTIAFVR